MERSELSQKMQNLLHQMELEGLGEEVKEIEMLLLRGKTLEEEAFLDTCSEDIKILLNIKKIPIKTDCGGIKK